MELIMNKILKRKKYLLLGSALIVVCIIIALTSTNNTTENVPVGTACRGALEIKLVESGDVYATNSRIITSPTGTKSQLQITYLIPEGTRVKKGDVLAQFDTKTVESRIEDYTKSYEQHKQELRKIIAQHESIMDGLLSDLKVMENTFKLAELSLANLKFESESKKKEGELQFQNAKLNLDEQREKIKNQKIINQVELENANLKIKDDSVKIAFWKDRLKALTVRAPMEGLVVHHENFDWRNRTYVKVKEGDNVWEGTAIIHLPDTYEMKIGIRVNEVDVGKLHVGQKAQVVLDAYPELVFHGTIESISALVEDLETNVREFNIEIVIDEKNEPHFRPGMTARVEIITKKLEDVVYVPTEAVYEIDGQPVVFIMEGNPKLRYVTTGERNLNYIEIKENLMEGEKIALKDPTGTAQLLGTAEKKRIELAQRQAIIEKFAGFDFDAVSAGQETENQEQKGRTFGPPEEMMEQAAQKLLQNPNMRKEYEKRIKDDPDLRTNTEKRMRFFQEIAIKHLGTEGIIPHEEQQTPGEQRGNKQFDLNSMTPEQKTQFENRLLQNPDVKKEYDERLKNDPELATDQNKRNTFFREMMNKLRASRQRENR